MPSGSVLLYISDVLEFSVGSLEEHVEKLATDFVESLIVGGRLVTSSVGRSVDEQYHLPAPQESNSLTKTFHAVSLLHSLSFPSHGLLD